VQSEVEALHAELEGARQRLSQAEAAAEGQAASSADAAAAAAADTGAQAAEHAAVLEAELLRARYERCLEE
jgi:hypothetical protein